MHPLIFPSERSIVQWDEDPAQSQVGSSTEKIYTNPYSNGVVVLHTGVNDAVVTGWEVVREVQGIFIRDIVWDRKKGNLTALGHILLDLQGNHR